MKNKNKVLLLALAAILMGTTGLFAQVNGEFGTADPVARALDKAFKSYQEGNLTEAASQLDNVINKDAKNPRAWFLRGLCKYQSKDYKSAFENIQNAIKLYPERSNESYDTRTMSYNMALERQRKYKSELRELEATLEVTDSCRSRKLRNRINFVQNKLAELQTLEEPTRNERVPSEYYFHMGNCLLKLNEISYAHDAYQMALVSDPSNGEAHHNLAIINFMVKRYEIANEHLLKAKELGAKINQNFEVQLTANLK